MGATGAGQMEKVVQPCTTISRQAECDGQYFRNCLKISVLAGQVQKYIKKHVECDVFLNKKRGVEINY